MLTEKEIHLVGFMCHCTEKQVNKKTLERATVMSGQRKGYLQPMWKQDNVNGLWDLSGLFAYYLLILFFKGGVLCIALLSQDSLCIPGWSQAHRDLPASVSHTLGLKVCAITAQLTIYLFTYLFMSMNNCNSVEQIT